MFLGRRSLPKSFFIGWFHATLKSVVANLVLDYRTNKHNIFLELRDFGNCRGLFFTLFTEYEG